MVFYSKQRKARRNAFRKDHPIANKLMKYGNMLVPKPYQFASKFAVDRLKELINTEFKYIDTNSSVTSVASMAPILLNGCIQGDSATQREGSTIRPKSVDLRYQLTYNATSVQNTVRVMVIIDRQPNGATYSMVDLLSTNAVDSPRNLDYRRRFKILYDKVHCIAANSNPQDYGHFHLKFKDLHTQYFNATNTGGIGDISTNAISLIAFSDQPINGPTFNYYTRVRFLDN